MDKLIKAMLRAKICLRLLTTRIAVADLVVLASVLIYVYLMADVSLLKYYSFNVTFTTTGVETHAIYLISKGGLPLYVSTHFNRVAFPYGDPFIYVLSFFYVFFPSIPALIVLGTMALGSSAIPLYLFSKKVLRSDFISMLIAISWLIYYGVSNENLSGDIYMMFFPIFFFLSCLFFVTNRPKAMALSIILAASINILLNIIMLIFALIHTSSTKDTNKAYAGALNEDRLMHTGLSRIVLLAILTFMFTAIFVLSYTSGNVQNISGSTNMSIVQILLTDINLKLLFFILLLAPLAFLPLLDGKSILMLIPVVGFIFYSVNQGTYVPFGHQYTIVPAPIFFYGLVRVLSMMRNQSKPLDSGGTGFIGSLEKSVTPLHHRMVLAVVLFSVVFASVYFPVSPFNEHVSGGLFSGNQEVTMLTAITPDSQFLWKTINLVPENASVYTQNNIPQLSNRPYYQVPEIPNLGFVPDDILIDTNLTFFSSGEPYFSIINGGLTNHTYGIVAEGYGALLVQKGFRSSIELWHPYRGIYSGNSFNVYNGSRIGNAIVGYNASYAMWYGPGITLFPGEYSVTFSLASNLSNDLNTPLITLEVAMNGGAQVLNQTTVNSSDFTSPGTITTFTLNFHVGIIIQDVQFRGMSPTGIAKLTLDQVNLLQISL
ncbi:MAG: DUF2079 domain-containing protein [Thermoplasmataceae archaeon]